MNIVEHRVGGAPYVPTNKKGGKITPTAIVLHFTAGWTSAGDIDTLARSERPASAHGVLARDGKWTQIVPFNEKAWHAGPSRLNGAKNANDWAIGIEISNIGYLNVVTRGQSYTDEYGNRVYQCVDLAKRENYISVAGKRRVDGILADWPHYVHPRIGSQLLAWEPYYEPQLKFLDELIPALLKAYPSIKNITTHEVIDTRGWKTDVAPHFPFSRYSSLGAEMILEPHATLLPRPVVLPQYAPKPPDTVTVVHLNENEAPPPVFATPTEFDVARQELGDKAAPGPSPTVIAPAPKKPWLTFFGRKIAFEDAWFDNKDSDIA